MSYDFGQPNYVTGSQLALRVKTGNVVDRRQFDDADPNAWQEFVNNAANTGKIPVFMGADANGVTRLNNPGGVQLYALNLLQLATPAVPVITHAGTAGAATWTYKVVAFSGTGATLGVTPASTGGSTTSGNATLTSANYNIITWASVPGAAGYYVYRTTSGGTPSTTGLIATVAATIDPATNIHSASYVLNDTALAGDSTTAPTVNSTGMINVHSVGSLGAVALATPVGVTATVGGTAGSTTISYKVVAKTQDLLHTAASSIATVTTANATLSTTNKVTVAWDPVPGAYSYDVYRTAAGGTPSTTGIIANVLATAALTVVDTGLAGDSATAPTTNTTGVISAPRVNISTALTSAAANNYVVAAGSNNAITVALTDPYGVNIPQAAGLLLTVKLANSLQAGANTLAFNGASAAAIKKATNPSSDLGTAFVSGSIVQLAFDGTVYQMLSQ